MTVVAIIQARMSSNRFPGKVLRPLLGIPCVVFMVQRARRARLLDRIVVATSSDPSDDVLARALAEHNVEYFRGKLDDVLDRFHEAASAADAGSVVRLTADCPLIDSDLIDAVVQPVKDGAADYASNIGDPPRYPDGLDVEAFTREALVQAWQEAHLPSDREHVTPFLRRQPERFRCATLKGLADMSALRWTVDHPDDFSHVEALVRAVGAQEATQFDRFDLYRAVERHAHLREPRHHDRYEGYAKSLAADPK